MGLSGHPLADVIMEHENIASFHDLVLLREGFYVAP